jgi:hypothetical protein
MLLWIIMVSVEIMLLSMGCKGLFGEGIAVSNTSKLTGTAGKVVGVILLLIALALSPVLWFMTVVVFTTR